MRLWMGLGVALTAAAALWGQEFRVGLKVGDFTLQDLKGGPVDFSSLKGDVTVVTFISVQCPVSNSYNDRMKAIYNDYAAKGVKFVFVNANATESAEAVAAHAAAHGFPFAVYKDAGNEAADRFGATVTPEAYVIDKTGTLRYHGSIDDSMDARKASDQRLRHALDAVLAGEPVAPAESKAFGCSIKRVKKAS